MTRTRKPVDAVVVGVGLVGSIVAKALVDAGLSVVGLERGPARDIVPDFQAPDAHDELKYSVRKNLMVDAAKETFTFRNRPGQTALPMRRLEMFLPGSGVGGSTVHWNGVVFRFQESDFVLRSHLRDRYGPNFVDPALGIADWGVTYADLEPHYDRFERLYGVCGKTGNLAGVRQPGGNPLEAPRSREYPNPPMKELYAGRLFRNAAESLGYHPFVGASCNLTRAYTNPLGLTLQPCVYCGFCERYACEQFAKASPLTTILPVLRANRRFELRAQAQVLRVNVDRDGRRATGVTYVDAAGRETFQPASLVIVAAYAVNNVRLLLLSGIGTPYDSRTDTGTVGRNYAFQTISAATVFYDQSVRINPFMASGATGTYIDDFSGENFDHGPHGFVGGGFIGPLLTGGRPIEFRPVPPGTPRWGREWKAAVARHYNHTVNILCHGSSMPVRTNCLDLDPSYRDAWGQPLLRVTYDFPDNDLKMSRFITAKAMEIAQRMGGQRVGGGPRSGPAMATQYQSTHNTGGTIMGDDPKRAVVNRYLQSWDVPNVFVIGASNFVHNGSYTPTGTVGALAYWAAEALTGRYLKQPGALVTA
jgi:gluconate 2-dehydrogenase alpha chain